MRDHDGAWLSWFDGAPDFVNAPFLERYGTRILDGPLPPTPAPTSTATPPPATPEPTPAPVARGFTIRGQGPTTVPVEASGQLACTAEVSSNVTRTGYPEQFNVSIHGTGYHPAPTGLGWQRGPVRRSVGSTRDVTAVTLRPRVIFLGEADDLDQALLPPYAVGVYAGVYGQWTVTCEPVEPLPEARGFTVTGSNRSSAVVWGDDVLALDGEPTGLLECLANWWPPHRSYHSSGPGFQWTLWGHDEAGERVSYGGPRNILRDIARIRLGEARPGSAAFLPPYSFQVFSVGEYLIKCEPRPPDRGR